MYNRLRVQHGAYGLGIYDLPDAPLATSRVLRIRAASRMSSMMERLLVEPTHQMSWLSTIAAVRCVARHHHCAIGCNLSFRNQLSRQSTLVNKDLGQGLSDAKKPESIVPLLRRQGLGKDIRSLLSCVNVLDADTATRRQLLRDAAQIHFVSSADVSELWGVSLLDNQNGSLIILVDD